MRHVIFLAAFVLFTTFGCAAVNGDELVATGQSSAIIDGVELSLDLTVWRLADEDRYGEVALPGAAEVRVEGSPIAPTPGEHLLEVAVVYPNGVDERVFELDCQVDDIDAERIAEALRDQVDPRLLARLEVAPVIEAR